MAPRSRTGCLTCRSRKLKCSEERPVCAQCLKANRECIPSSGITFRHQQNPSMNGDPVAEGSLKRFYGYKETFNDKTVWLPIPQGLTFVHTSNPYEDEEGAVDGRADDDDNNNSTLLEHTSLFDTSRSAADLSLSQALYPHYPTHGLEALSAVASQDQYNYAPVPTGGSLPHEIASSALDTTLTTNTDTQSLDFMLNSSAALSSPSNLDPRLHTPARSQPDVLQDPIQSPHHVRTSSYTSTRPASLLSQGTTTTPIRDRELAFFLRDFSERAGHWMDIFDLDCWFGVHVPTLAVQCPLLLYSCAALSAKSLSRVNGRKPVMNGQTAPECRAKMESWPGQPMSKEAWIRKGREYYDLAISLLRQALSGASRPHTSDLPEAASPTTISTAQNVPLPSTSSDELVTATAVLCVYEFLDASGAEWSRHLDGAKSLFDIARDGMVPLTLPSSPISIAQHVSRRLSGKSDRPLAIVRRLSQGRIAVFWNFARQDMLSAFIEGTRTRFDTMDLAMWKHAGLRLTIEGTVSPSNPRHSEYDRDDAMQDDMICNALIWLMAKMVNFIADSAVEPDNVSPLGGSVRQQHLNEEWHNLDDHFRRWHQGLPDTFKPTAAIAYNTSSATTERWFPRSMCASTMQSYHFARIQLLHHKPAALQASAIPAAGLSLATRHAEYAQLLQRSRFHAKEIVSIGLSRADEGARVHAVQPLWTAGLVLGGQAGEESSAQEEAHGWRCAIVSQLRAIEIDMGWAAEYRVQNLLALWGLPPDWRPDVLTNSTG